jgi:uncharacterized protein (TIGR03086 family)
MTTMLDRFLVASTAFDQLLREVGAERWHAPTPCPEWTVRQLTNHMTRGNLNYVDLVAGAGREAFLRKRTADALGADPVAAYDASVRLCAEAFGSRGALNRLLDYPLGPVTGERALAIRTADSAAHGWDLARALDRAGRIDPGLVRWLTEEFDGIFGGLAEMPGATVTTHRFFAEPAGEPGGDASAQDRLLHRLGRDPEWQAD